MKKDITELPSDVQKQIRVSEAMPNDEIDTSDASCFSTGPTLGAVFSTGLLSSRLH